MILDNAKIHHAKLLTNFLQDPPGCSWNFCLLTVQTSTSLKNCGGLKSTVINNVFFHTREVIRLAVQAFIDYIASIPLVVIDRLCI